ncbi:MAG: VWA domain-containing protein [Bdellovibrionaceae bacterium]|nr:VWA domain-containing protein [Pseudobdellovibrionaceae bacterium]
MKNRMLNKMLLLSAAVALFTGCEKSTDSFSLMSASSSFKQNVAYVQRPVDILWVIDNSGSMDTSQQRLAANFQSFINRFSTLGYDFRMGVITTDAYLGYHYNSNNRSRLKDRGVDIRGTPDNCVDDLAVISGVRVMDKNTPNLSQVFVKNAMQGVCGSGDERAFSSFEHALSNPLNNDFRRPGAFLSIIIVSDEDDFSHYDWQNGDNSLTFNENYSQQFPISRFTNFLDTLTDSTAGGIRNYNVSTISVLDAACRSTLSTDGFQRKISTRYMALADATGGTKGSLCADFGLTLQMISDKIMELSTVFKLDREPHPSTIQVIVDGVTVPNSATNGWTYDAANWSISFHGNAVPNSGSDVRIYFDPKSVKL